MPFAKTMSRDQRVCNATSNTPQRDPRDRHRREIPYDTTIAPVATEFSFLIDVSRSRRTETSTHEQTVYLYRCLSLFFLVLRLNWTTIRSPVFFPSAGAVTAPSCRERARRACKTRDLSSLSLCRCSYMCTNVLLQKDPRVTDDG